MSSISENPSQDALAGRKAGQGLRPGEPPERQERPGQRGMEGVSTFAGNCRYLQRVDTKMRPSILPGMETDVENMTLAQGRIAMLLEEHGILPTAQRVEIAYLMLQEPQHLSADQVLTRSREAGLGVSKATVYNTLGLLVDKGLIREVIVDSSKVFYDSNTAPHYHFYNIDDGTLADVDVRELAIDSLPMPPAGTVATGVDIVIRIRNRD